jgi:hypothetical protein
MEKTGYCNICGCYSRLTADHVPPKGSNGLSDTEMKTLIRYLSVDPQRPKIYKNGVKFRTLCGGCNNDRLGGSYDPALIEISKSVSRIVRINYEGFLKLPPEIKFPAKVQRVARAIVGHLLAVLPANEAGQSITHAPFPDAMRDYFLDPFRPLPKGMNIHYWVYPSDLQIVARGLGVGDARSMPHVIVGDIIKFFPLGY